MEETSLLNSILRLLVLLGVLALILVAGWNEPLKYRFMDRPEISAPESPAPATDSSWMWDKSRPGKLNRGAYSRSGGSAAAYGSH